MRRHGAGVFGRADIIQLPRNCRLFHILQQRNGVGGIIAEEGKPQGLQKDLLNIFGVVRREIIMRNEPLGAALQYRLIRTDKCLKIPFIPALDCLNKICVQIIEPHAAFIAFGKGRCAFGFFFAEIFDTQNFIIDFPKLQITRTGRRKNIVPYRRLVQPFIRNAAKQFFGSLFVFGVHTRTSFPKKKQNYFLPSAAFASAIRLIRTISRSY